MEFFNRFRRAVKAESPSHAKEILEGEPVFHYDPNFRGEQMPENYDGKFYAAKQPDGSRKVGPDEVRMAVESARNFGTESARTGYGLSLEYIREHFPEALADLEKAEK